MIPPHILFPGTEQMRISLPTVAREVDRFGISNRAAASICTALLVDLGLVNENEQTMIIDTSKIRRQRQSLRNYVAELDAIKMQSKAPKAIYFDGKKDRTLCKDEKTGALVWKQEEHYVVVAQSSGEYLTHLQPDTSKAKDIANYLIDYLDENGIASDIKVIGCDSTSVNTGSKGGVVHIIENLLHHKVLWSICMLHTNELPFRHLFVSFDGPTSGKDSFKGEEMT